MPPLGSSTSPLPVMTSVTSLSATIIIASRLRRYLSVRQSLASSTAARSNWPLWRSSLLSSRSNRVKASAVAPAKPPMTLPSCRRRTLRALGFITVWPIDTWPSPMMTTLSGLRAERMVVPCQGEALCAWGSFMRRIWESGARGARGGQSPPHFARHEREERAVPLRHRPRCGRRRRPSLIGPQSARVINDLAAAFLERDRFEHVMVDEHDHDVTVRQRIVEFDEFGAAAGEFHRQALGKGFDDLDALAELARERCRDLDRRAFAEIVDIGFESETEHADLGVGMAGDQRRRRGDDMRGLRQITLARGADQPAFLGRAMYEEPRIDGDAMTADAGPGLQDVDARMEVGEADHVPPINPHLVGDHRQSIGEGNVDVAVAVLDQLDHFGGAGGGGDAGAAHELAVKGHRAAGAARGDAADAAVVVDQLDQDAARQHALGAISDEDVGGAGAAPRNLEA